jgi:hypothetical protein
MMRAPQVAPRTQTWRFASSRESNNLRRQFEALVTTDPTKETATTGKPKLIAAWWHLLGYFAIIAWVAISGYRAQQAGISGSATPAGQLGSHSEAYRFYLTSIGMDWLFFYYCWVGVHLKGGDLSTLTGGRWPT